MVEREKSTNSLGPEVRFSFYFMCGLLLVMILLRLASPLVAALFTYLALSRLTWHKLGGKPVAVGLFLVFSFGILYALGNFIHQTVHALPEIADKAIPSIID